ncbi:MAG: ABC transporter ATP-binding protein, partial [Oscillospiraceae bacterium]|nr:ABC transporter ATP-binding protein [Oscillospiraceae bacterium]
MFKILKRLRGAEWAMAAASVVFVFAQVWLDLKLPDYMNEITQILQRPDSAMREIWAAGLNMLLVTLGSAGTAVVVGYFGARVGAGLSHRLRADVFARVTSFSMEEMNGFSTASLITRTTNDITQIQMIIAMGLQIAIKAPVTAVWALFKVSSKQWEWTALTVGCVLALLIMIVALMSYALPRFRKIQTLTDNINRLARENLTGLRVVRAYNAETYEEAKFAEANGAITANNLSVHRAMTVFNPGMRMIISALMLGIFWIGAYLISNAELTRVADLFADMMAFSQYAMQILMSFMMLIMIFIMAPRVMVSVRRVNEVLDTEPKISDGSRTNGAPSVPGEVEFRGVSFKYPDADEYVLRDVSFKVGRGQTAAFIGATGAGKSTLMNLVPRFYDATEGQVLVDGADVR